MLSLKTLDQKDYITHPKVMIITNSVDILYTTDYITNNS